MHRSRRVVIALLCVFALNASELRFCLRSEPKTFDPALVDDSASEAIRYLTGGVLIRVNRGTQAPEPSLATSWKVSEAGRRIDFQLRSGARFSDGTPLSPEDVVFTMRRLMDPALHAATADDFHSTPGPIEAKATSATSVMIRFPGAIAGLPALFDQVAIQSRDAGRRDKATLGAFYVAEYHPGSQVLLRRNPNYWKRDAHGTQMPYLESIRLDIQQNRDLELLRYRRGELDLISNLAAEQFDQINAPNLQRRDLGVSLDSEQIWFNEVPDSPLPEFKKRWFASVIFRHGISEAINRADLCKIVYRGHAQPAAGPISPANRFWFNRAIRPVCYDPAAALASLAKDGFHQVGDRLLDKEGHRVEFSVLTNAGNKNRERILVLVQQDLAKIGVHLNIVTLDFPSLIERIAHSYNYEACLLGLTNSDLEPNHLMNVWLSSGSNHQWNPNQKTPATPWEAEVDALMRAQASTLDDRGRKKAFDRVQQLARDWEPFIYLVHPSALAAVSSRVQGTRPAVLHPQLYWNVDEWRLAQ